RIYALDVAPRVVRGFQLTALRPVSDLTPVVRELSTAARFRGRQTTFTVNAPPAQRLQALQSRPPRREPRIPDTVLTEARRRGATAEARTMERVLPRVSRNAAFRRPACAGSRRSASPA